MPGKSLPRRTLLKGIGTAIALPLLDSMIPAFTRAAVAKPPCRMAMLYVPNGIIMDEWLPQALLQAPEGVSALPSEFPRVSSVLAPFRSEMMMLGGLTQNGGRALGDGPGDHARRSELPDLRASEEDKRQGSANGNLLGSGGGEATGRQDSFRLDRAGL